MARVDGVTGEGLLEGGQEDRGHASGGWSRGEAALASRWSQMLLRGVGPRELLAQGACSGRSSGPGGADAQGTAILCPSLPDTGQALSPFPLPQVQTIEMPVPILRAPALPTSALWP